MRFGSCVNLLTEYNSYKIVDTDYRRFKEMTPEILITRGPNNFFKNLVNV
jgi:hypothetical protein